jgi:hypothetical protein
MLAGDQSEGDQVDDLAALDEAFFKMIEDAVTQASDDFNTHRRFLNAVGTMAKPAAAGRVR